MYGFGYRGEVLRYFFLSRGNPRLSYLKLFQFRQKQTSVHEFVILGGSMLYSGHVISRTDLHIQNPFANTTSLIIFYPFFEQIQLKLKDQPG